MSDITFERLCQEVSYCKETGVFTMLKSAGNKKKGSRCGVVVQGNKTNTYLRTMIDGKRYKLHRLAFLYVTGLMPAVGMDVDHIDGDGLNNRFENLRVVSRKINSKNCKLSSANTSGVCGVYKRESGSWRAVIRVNKRLISLGSFKEMGHAVKAREEANKAYGFSEIHGKR